MTGGALRRGASIALLALALVAAGTAILRNNAFDLDPYLTDLRAFYCAGSVANAGANPYTFEPMHTCEMRLISNPRRFVSWLTVPAPIPGYSIALFRGLALLPFELVVALVFGATVISFCAIVLLVHRLTGVAPIAAAAAFALSGVLLHAIELGQVVPFAVLGLVAAARYLRRGDAWRTAAALGLLALQPQFAAGAIAAVFVFVPAMRVAVAALAAGLALLSLAAMPLATNLLYYQTVLGAHVRSELLNEEQFGVPALIVALGGSQAAALSLAPWFGLAALIAGLATAALLARRMRDPAYFALVPPAFALLGGPFVHVHQLAAAIPAALTIYAAWPRYRPIVGYLVILLAIPWIDYVWGSPALAIAPAAVAAILCWSLISRSVIAAALAAAFAAGAILAIAASYPAPGRVAYAIPAAPDPGALAETTWEDYVVMTFRSNPARYEAGKAISRVGLGGLAIVLAALALTPRRREPAG